MIRRVYDGVAPVVDHVVVNCRRDQRRRLARALGDVDDVRFAVDPVPGRGPAAGIATGCAASPSPYTAVVACDMPNTAPGPLAQLFEHATDHDAAVPRVDGHLQPTFGVYRTGAVRVACRRELDDGTGRLTDVVAALDAVVVTGDALAASSSCDIFADVNTRSKLETVRAARD